MKKKIEGNLGTLLSKVTCKTKYGNNMYYKNIRQHCWQADGIEIACEASTPRISGSISTAFHYQ